MLAVLPFSILERIDVGETSEAMNDERGEGLSFSILERIDVGETICGMVDWCAIQTFSILERIDVGETPECKVLSPANPLLSVSSNGSTWVKLAKPRCNSWAHCAFQYPRTDRRG